jgi:hypothetical protein
MVVSALVVSLPPDPEIRAALLAHLAGDPRITVGDSVRDRLPVVAETATAGDGARLVEALGELPGVRVDVVAIDFSQEDE